MTLPSGLYGTKLADLTRKLSYYDVSWCSWCAAVGRTTPGHRVVNDGRAHRVARNIISLEPRPIGSVVWFWIFGSQFYLTYDKVWIYARKIWISIIKVAPITVVSGRKPAQQPWSNFFFVVCNFEVARKDAKSQIKKLTCNFHVSKPLVLLLETDKWDFSTLFSPTTFWIRIFKFPAKIQIETSPH